MRQSFVILQIILCCLGYGFDAKAFVCLDFLNTKVNSEFSFFIPQSDFRKVEFIDVEIDSNHFVVDKNMDLFLEHLNQMLLSLQPAQNVETVFYPAIGSDAITAFRVFSKANLVIGVGTDPFISEGRKNVSYLDRPKIREGWDVVGKTLGVSSVSNDQADVVEIVIADLKNYFPNLVVVDIIEARSQKVGSLGRHSVSGVLRFRESPGGDLKTYVHLHTPILDQRELLAINDPAFSYLNDYVLQYGFQAVIAKASMNVFHKIDFNMFMQPIHKFEGVVRELAYEFGHMLKEFSFLSMEYLNQERVGYMAIDYLINNGGLLVDGDGVGLHKNGRLSQETKNDNYSIYSLKPEDILDFEQSASGKLSYEFGYVRDVDIFVFDPPR